MQQPGSNPDIPETAAVTFHWKWSKRKPGEKELVGFLELSESTLAVVPYRGWTPEEGKEYDVVLYPLKNAAVAAPVGGIEKRK